MQLTIDRKSLRATDSFLPRLLSVDRRIVNAPTLDTQSALPMHMLSESVEEVLRGYESAPEQLVEHLNNLEQLPSQRVSGLREEPTSITIETRFEVTACFPAWGVADASFLVMQPSLTLDDDVAEEISEEDIDSVFGLARAEFGNAHRCHMYMSTDPDDSESPSSLVLRVSSGLARADFLKQRQVFFRRAMKELSPSLFAGLRVVGEAIEAY